MINELPIYRAEITEELDGLTAVSLVEFPAVETDFLCFNKEQPKLNFQIENEEKRLVVGCLMRCDFPIYRIGPSGYEYFILFDKETIIKMAEKALKEGFINNINLNHDENKFVEGVVLREIFIKDTEKGISPKGFEDITDGSLFATYHIENDEVWQEIKNGTFKGYSLEGYFTIEEIKNNNKEEKTNKMSKLEKLKELIIEMMSEETNVEETNVEVKFGSTTTDNGIVIFWNGEELEVGKQIQVEDEEGNKVDSTEDYTITMEDYIVTIEKGIVTNIEEVEKEIEEEPTEDVVEEVVEETNVEETNVEDTMEEVKEEEVENPTNEGEETDTEAIVKLREEVNELYSIVNELKKELEELKSKPTEKPVEQEFEQIEKKELKGAGRYTQYIRRKNI